MVSRATRRVRGEIWLVDFRPTRGSEQSGTRPALIFSSNRYQRAQSRLVIVLPFTSRLKDYPFRVTVQPDETGLDKPSAIMIDQVRVVATERFVQPRAIGQITDDTLAKVEQLFQILFELP